MMLSYEPPKGQDVAFRAFRALSHGMETGDWRNFLSLVTDDFTLYRPSGKWQGLNSGKHKAEEFLASVSTAFDQGLFVQEVTRVTAGGNTWVFEFWDKATLRNAPYTHRVALALDVRGDKISAYREYTGGPKDIAQQEMTS